MWESDRLRLLDSISIGATLALQNDLFPDVERPYPLALGTNVFGWTVGAPTALEVLDVFVDSGGTVIDTADVYSAWLPGNSGGESETIIGRWLSRPGNRDRVVVSTKVGQHPDAPGLTAESVRRAVDASLARLKTDRIDLLFAHYDDDDTPLDETVGVFSELVDQGKIRYPAASNYTGSRMRQALAIADRDRAHPFAAVQPAYNLVRRADYEADLWPIVDHFDLAVLPHSTLASGFLTAKYRDLQSLSESPRGSRALSYLTPRNIRILDVQMEIAEAHGVAPGAVAIAWTASRPHVIGALASARSAIQLENLLAAGSLELSADELERLTAVSDPALADDADEQT
ncbi:aldo/keto reductase [Frondihabitans australicus]|uniref:Aryl-alcohol dehydrogenase-like predicted oxidoreductase n=1 Tax=Frondihabitans australicus TaxID=386892 RepID=A0A495IAP5_9MICO|nr:aldo/keto reductase [Frondihabitans australicus]RKR73077.1 aryl-alcohol dehydrogenase-like predicted oxidoreductase [Frondihabitans australicus]